MAISIIITRLSLLLLWPMAVAEAADPPRVAVFDLELIDTSLEGSVNGTRTDEQARLKKIGEQLRKKLADSGRFIIADIGPIEKEARDSNLQSCGGCDVAMAKKVAADLSITGTVQKVSNLILNVNLYIHDVATGNPVTNMSADFRGNTDESWARAMDYLIRNRLLQPNFGAH